MIAEHARKTLLTRVRSGEPVGPSTLESSNPGRVIPLGEFGTLKHAEIFMLDAPGRRFLLSPLKPIRSAKEAGEFLLSLPELMRALPVHLQNYLAEFFGIDVEPVHESDGEALDFFLAVIDSLRGDRPQRAVQLSLFGALKA